MAINKTTTEYRALHISLIYMLVAGVWFFSAHGLVDSMGSRDFFALLWRVKSAFFFLVFSALLLYHHLHLFEVRQAALARHYDSLGKYANDIILLCNGSGRIVEANDRALAAYGYSLQEMLAMHNVELLAPEERANLTDVWSRIGREGGLIFETVHNRKDGTTFPVEVSARTIQMEDQEWCQATIRDITERKQAEKALRESEEKFRNIMESSLVSIYVIQDGTFKYVNQTLLEKSGYTEEELLGQCSPLDLIAPEHRETVARNLQERLAGVPGHPYEIRILRKDGTYIDVVAWGSVIQFQGRLANVGTLVDITERKRAEAELRKLSRAIEQSASTVVITDRDGNIEYINPHFTESTGYPREEAIGQNPRMLKSGYTSDEEYQKLWQDIASGQVWKGEFKNKRKDGSYFWEYAIISPVLDEHGVITHFVAVKDDITTQKAVAERIERLAHYDTLTGLPNKDSLCDRLTDAIDLAQSKAGHAALLTFDLDRFKDINDSLGHQVGNELLLQLAERIRHCCRDEDTVARISGDEFAVVLPDTDAEGAVHVGKKILRLVQQPFVVDGRHLTLTCSMGIAISPADGADVDTMLRNADAAQHQAEALGGDNFQFFAIKMNDAALQHLMLENELRGAVQRGELELYFQPQIRLADGVIDGTEALVRWRHPQRGLVPPAEFIPIAEECGLIVEIGRWVLQEACRQAKSWQQEGLPAIIVAVNLSALQFRRGNLLEQVSDALRDSGLEPRFLELELTESVILQDMDEVRDVLLKVAEMGIGISIDDFGTGYSSFAYLRKLHIDKLKIDQSFVRGVLDSEEDAAIVNAIIALARALKINVVAEGVETEEVCRFIKQAGCDQAQGYYCSKPLEIGQFKQMLEQGCPHHWQ
jgi:diguanylate cyclase (GGDEF)-like protein/PAS domain S-box-containing protein